MARGNGTHRLPAKAELRKMIVRRLTDMRRLGLTVMRLAFRIHMRLDCD
jgi:hypothetical protein